MSVSLITKAVKRSIRGDIGMIAVGYCKQCGKKVLKDPREGPVYCGDHL